MVQFLNPGIVPAGWTFVESYDDEPSICSFIMAALFHNKAAHTLIGRNFVDLVRSGLP
jgi:uncharacterized protein (DUF1800 family)